MVFMCVGVLGAGFLVDCVVGFRACVIDVSIAEAIICVAGVGCLSLFPRVGVR